MQQKESEESMFGSSASSCFYETLAKTRSIIISGEVNQKLAEKTIHQLLFLQGISEEPITVYINSQGGHVESGDTIFDMFKFVKPRIIMIGTGWVASAAITIYLGAAKSDRYSLINTRYLIHQPAGGVHGSALILKLRPMRSLKFVNGLTVLSVRETGQTFEKVEADTERNFWMNAIEAKEYGIVGKIVSSVSEIH